MNRFITFEGTEGSGKSTQIRLLADALRSLGREVVVTREPGGTPLGEALRALLLNSQVPISGVVEAYLMTGARAEHVRSVIQPALERGSVVLCDRYVDSTLAYQGAGRGLPLDELLKLQALAVGTTVPALTLLLALPVELGLQRRTRADGQNRIDMERLDFHQRVADWYATAAQLDPARWSVIDAAPAPDVVHTQILTTVLARLDAMPVLQTGGRLA